VQVGTIKNYLAERGFGFIKPDDGGEDQFFHFREWQARDTEPQEGQQVSYDVGSDRWSARVRAVNVRIV
jgi:cold shock protein